LKGIETQYTVPVRSYVASHIGCPAVEEYYTTTEAAGLLGLQPLTVRNAVRRGRLASVASVPPTRGPLCAVVTAR